MYYTGILAYDICRIGLCSRPFDLPSHHATDLQINYEITKTRSLHYSRLICS